MVENVDHDTRRACVLPSGLAAAGCLYIFLFLLPNMACEMSDRYCICILVSLKIKHNCGGSLQLQE